MCNDYRLLADATTLFADFSETKIKIRFSEGKPNLEAREDIRITDTAPIVRTVDGAPQAGDMVQRRWSWLGQNGKPVYTFRSEGREFASGRCLIPADGFYEFTDPADKKKKRKDKWLFAKVGEPLFCIAGIWRTDKDVGEAFTMLTMPPGPDMARSVNISQSTFEAASFRRPYRPTSGLGAHNVANSRGASAAACQRYQHLGALS
jgi:putative SOS response-associated peptidase YedK